MKAEEYCNEFHKLDLRNLDNCLKVTKGVHHVYNLAADMGGMGKLVLVLEIVAYSIRI